MVNGTINVLYFAQVAETMGTRQETRPLDQEIQAGAWLDELAGSFPALQPASRLKLAINQQHADRNAMIRPGDEVAVFEPVTGG